MIKKLKDWFSKPAKGSPKTELDTSNLAAYFSVGIQKNDEILITGDFIDGNDELVSKLLFVMFSGAVTEHFFEVIKDRCGGDEKRARIILIGAQKMLLQYMENTNEEEDEEYEDDEPVVDPCCVFRPKREIEEDELSE